VARCVFNTGINQKKTAIGNLGYVSLGLGLVWKNFVLFSSLRAMNFYSASAWLAMQTAVLARPFLSVCLSVRYSVTFRCFVRTNEDTIVRFSAFGRTIHLEMS